MSTEVVLRRSDVPGEFQAQVEMAKYLAGSSLLPAHLRGQPANVFVVLQGARALDVSAFWALQSMHVIEGKLSMAAELMRALVNRAGHRVTVVERSSQRAVVEIQRSDRTEPYRAEFTWEDAKAAKLTGKTNWQGYPKSMMVARATAIAVRDECPDVLFGMVYTPDELGAVTDEDGEPLVGADGKPLVEAEEVVPFDPEEALDVAAILSNADLAEVVTTWQRTLDRASALVRVPETDQSLADYLHARLAIEAQVAGTKAAVRALWEVANLCKVDSPTVTIGGEEWALRAYLVQAGKALPEEAEPEPEGPPETDHARNLREEAEKSWADDQHRERANREKAFADLAAHRQEAAERLGRNLPPAETPLEVEVVD
jgi:hypothetical protein